MYPTKCVPSQNHLHAECGGGKELAELENRKSAGKEKSARIVQGFRAGKTRCPEGREVGPGLQE